jgi:hypothetical protein
MSFKSSYNKSSVSNYASTNKSSVNAFRTVNPKINLVPVLTAAAFPSLSETTCSINTCNDVDNSYLTKVKKVNILEKDAVLPGFVQIDFDKSTNKMVYTYGLTLNNKNNVTTEANSEIIHADAVFTALNALYEKRKASYIDLWGIDTYESVFGKAIIYEEEDENDYVEEQMYE